MHELEGYGIRSVHGYDHILEGWTRSLWCHLTLFTVYDYWHLYQLAEAATTTSFCHVLLTYFELATNASVISRTAESKMPFSTP